MRSIGVLGGMGPEATILLMQKVLAAVPAQDDADHVPLIVHQNPQVPSRIAALIEGTGPSPASVLAQMVQDLEQAGAQVLAMPCNTAHHYADAITGASDLPFLHMPELTAQHLAAIGAHRVGVLASPAVRFAGVFDEPLTGAGVRGVFLADDAPLLRIIQTVKTGVLPDIEALDVMARSLLDQDCDHILLACTELSLMATDLAPDIPWTDSLDVLAAAIVAEARARPGV